MMNNKCIYCGTTTQQAFGLCGACGGPLPEVVIPDSNEKAGRNNDVEFTRPKPSLRERLFGAEYSRQIVEDKRHWAGSPYVIFRTSRKLTQEESIKFDSWHSRQTTFCMETKNTLPNKFKWHNIHFRVKDFFYPGMIEA